MKKKIKKQAAVKKAAPVDWFQTYRLKWKKAVKRPRRGGKKKEKEAIELPNMTIDMFFLPMKRAAGATSGESKIQLKNKFEEAVDSVDWEQLQQLTINNKVQKKTHEALTLQANPYRGYFETLAKALIDSQVLTVNYKHRYRILECEFYAHDYLTHCDSFLSDIIRQERQFVPSPRSKDEGSWTGWRLIPGVGLLLKFTPGFFRPSKSLDSGEGVVALESDQKIECRILVTSLATLHLHKPNYLVVGKEAVFQEVASKLPASSKPLHLNKQLWAHKRACFDHTLPLFLQCSESARNEDLQKQLKGDPLYEAVRFKPVPKSDSKLLKTPRLHLDLQSTEEKHFDFFKELFWMCDYRYTYHRFQELLFADYLRELEYQNICELTDSEVREAQLRDFEMEARFTMDALAVIRDTPDPLLRFDQDEFISPFSPPASQDYEPSANDQAEQEQQPTRLKDHPRDLTLQLVPQAYLQAFSSRVELGKLIAEYFQGILDCRPSPEWSPCPLSEIQKRKPIDMKEFYGLSAPLTESPRSGIHSPPYLFPDNHWLPEPHRRSALTGLDIARAFAIHQEREVM